MKIFRPLLFALLLSSSLHVAAFPSASAQGHMLYKSGDVTPPEYLDDSHAIHNYHFYHLRAPEDGYRWIHGFSNDYLLISTKTNIIRAIETRPNLPVGK
jgi:Ni/Co efflux regulator RcnB